MTKPRLDQGPDYERGFIDGMQHQMQSSVDKAVNRMAQPGRTWVGLTDEDVREVSYDFPPSIAEWYDRDFTRFIHALEAKLKEKNVAVGHVDLRYGWNEGDIRALVEALGKVRDGTGLYLCYRPVDVFQDWFLAFMEEAEKQWKKEKNT